MTCNYHIEMFSGCWYRAAFHRAEVVFFDCRRGGGTVRNIKEKERSAFRWTPSLKHLSWVIIEHMQNGRWRENMYYSVISQISNNFHQCLNYRSKRWNQERERLKFGRKCQRCEVFPKELKEKMGRIRRAISLSREKRGERVLSAHYRIMALLPL